LTFDNTQAAIVSESEEEVDHLKASDSEGAEAHTEHTASQPNHDQRPSPEKHEATNQNKQQHPLLIDFDDDLDAIDYHPTFDDKMQECITD